MEIIKGNPRRRWTDDEKRALVAMTMAPGASVSGVAKRHDVNPSVLFLWRKRFRGELASPDSQFDPAFAAVKVIEADASAAISSHPAPAPGIVVELAGGARVTITGSVDPGLIAVVMKSLARQ